MRNNSLYYVTGITCPCLCVYTHTPVVTNPSRRHHAKVCLQSKRKFHRHVFGTTTVFSTPFIILPDDNYVCSASHNPPPPPKPLACLNVATAITTAVGTLLLWCRWTNFTLSAIVVKILLLLLSLSSSSLS